MTWTIVKFVNENTVEAIPTSWLLGGQSYWPTFSKEKLLNCIRKNEKPNTCWPLHDVSVFRNGTYEDYQVARMKARKAEYFSDLASDTDKESRKLKKKKVISSSSDEDSTMSELPVPPRMPEKSSLMIDQNNELPGALEASTSTEIEDTGSCSCCREHKIGDSIKQLTKQQVLTRNILSEVLGEIKNMRTDKMNNITAPCRDVSSIFVEFEHFPIDSIEKIKLLEEYLHNGEKFEAAVNEVSKIGGLSLYDFMKRCLSSIMTNEFASEYSWYGAKKKRVFGKLKLAELLLEAANSNGLAPNKKISEEAIKSWLRRAKERHQLALKKQEKLQQETELNSILLFP